MPIFLLSNNPMVFQNLSEKLNIIFYPEQDFLAVLKSVRDRIHKGAVLLSHPLSGSVKPGQTPYKSVLLDSEGKTVDQDSLLIIENAIKLAEKMLSDDKSKKISEQANIDFQLIDFDLIRNALDQVMQHK